MTPAQFFLANEKDLQKNTTKFLQEFIRFLIRLVLKIFDIFLLEIFYSSRKLCATCTAN